jgi:hypothetical protein
VAACQVEDLSTQTDPVKEGLRILARLIATREFADQAMDEHLSTTCTRELGAHKVVHKGCVAESQ